MSTEAQKKATQLIHQAMEQWGTAQAKKLVADALKLDPNNPEGLGLSASMMTDNAEALKTIEKGIASAEALLGSNFESKYQNIFWLDRETRPYLRLLSQKVILLEAEDRTDEAITLLERILSLNSEDNLGHRHALVGLYLQNGAVEKADALMSTYAEDTFACMSWARVLGHLHKKDFDAATKQLGVARKVNPFVEELIFSEEELDEIRPAGFTLGSKEEAILTCYRLTAAWASFEGASLWLYGQILGDSTLISLAEDALLNS